MIKKGISILILIANIPYTAKAFKNLLMAFNSNGDTYNMVSGITYFVCWLLMFYLAYWLWSSGKKSCN